MTKICSELYSIPIHTQRCERPYRTWRNGVFAYPGSDFAFPYCEDKYINESGYAVDAEDDMCGKTINDCKARFGTAMPFMGFPRLDEITGGLEI